MVQIRVTLQNADMLRDAMRKAPEIAGEEISLATERTVVKIEGEAKRRAPVNKSYGGGTLRQSIRSGMASRYSGFVEVGAKYGVYVHEGTRPHVIRPRIKRVLANTRTGQFFGRLVRHPGTKAQPFLKDAVDASQQFIDDTFAQALDKTLGRVVG